jgi:hypothetical protein
VDVIQTIETLDGSTVIRVVTETPARDYTLNGIGLILTVKDALAVARAENDALLAEDNEHSEDVVEVRGDDGATVLVLKDVVDLIEDALRCDGCDVYAVDTINGQRNCFGFWCSECEPAHQCHRDCYYDDEA